MMIVIEAVCGTCERAAGAVAVVGAVVESTLANCRRHRNLVLDLILYQSHSHAPGEVHSPSILKVIHNFKLHLRRFHRLRH
jgi:hypothetical protein